MSESRSIVERLNWRRAGDLMLLLPGAERLAASPDRAAAEAHCQELEWQVRRRINPFQCGGPFLHYQTSFDSARLFDWCLDAGLEPSAPTNESSVWANWWAEASDQFTLAQRVHVWEALDRVRFYQVTTRAQGHHGYVVSELHYRYDPIDEIGLGRYAHVGGTPRLYARTRATAEELCEQLWTEELARTGAYVGAVTMPNCLAVDTDPFADEVRITDYPVEFRSTDLVADDPPAPGRDVYVVLRRHWRLELGNDGSWRWSLTPAKSAGRPVAVYATLAAADAAMAQLEADARAHATPFRFGPPHEWSHLHPSTLWGVLSGLAPIEFTSQWSDYTATDHLWIWWWDLVTPHLSSVQVEIVWSLFDRLRFYEIVAVEYRE